MSYRQSTGSPQSGAAPKTGSPISRLSPRASGPAKRRPLSGASPASSRPNNNAFGGGILRWSTEDSPGLKIGPTVVLVMSLLFIASVVLLHIWGKFTR